jgi:hypothetical protein
MVRGWLLALAALGAGCGRIGFAANDAAISDDVGTSADGPMLDAALRGCLPGESAGVATSDFATGAPAWSTPYATPPTVVDYLQGQMRVRPGMTSNPDAYSGIAGPVANYTGHRVFVHVPTMFNTAGCAQASLLVADEASNSTYFELDQSCGMLTAHFWIAGADNRLATIAYDRVAHAWWQIRESAGAVYFETSPDGAVWTAFAMNGTPTFVTHAYVDLGAGSYQLETVAIGEVRYDDLGECVTP